MKTIEEVREFVKHFGFSKVNANKIMGFLLGKGLIEKGEIIEFVERPITKGLEVIGFDDFYAWFENEEECVLCDLLNFIQDEQDKAMEEGNVEKADKMTLFLGFLVEELDLEYEEVNEDED